MKLIVGVIKKDFKRLFSSTGLFMDWKLQTNIYIYIYIYVTYISYTLLYLTKFLESISFFGNTY